MNLLMVTRSYVTKSYSVDKNEYPALEIATKKAYQGNASATTDVALADVQSSVLFMHQLIIEVTVFVII
jgi:hypothetical protein